jgi:hypothetical protein
MLLVAVRTANGYELKNDMYPLASDDDPALKACEEFAR